MAFKTITGADFSDVGPSGLREFSSGSVLHSSDLNGNLQDSQAYQMYSNLSGVLIGGPCTSSGLIVTIPSGVVYFARQLWTSDSPTSVAVPDESSVYVWGCSDGVLRLTTTTVPPSGFDNRTACIITRAVSSAGSVTVDDSVRHLSRVSNGSSRTVTEGNVHIDTLLGILTLRGIIQGHLSISVAGSSDVVLTDFQSSHGMLSFTGVLTGNISVILPLTAGRAWHIFNNTTGAFTLTVRGSTGAGRVISQGKRDILITDGSNFYSAVTDISFSGSAPDSASYVTTSSEGGLSNEKVLGSEVIMSGVSSGRPSAGIAGRLYYSTDTDVLSRDNGSSWVDVEIDWGKITGKPSSFVPSEHDHSSSGDGGILTNSRFDGYLQISEISTPSNPPSDNIRVYAKDSGGVTKFYYKRSDGTEVEIGESSLISHNHTSGSGDGGVLTNDEHDGYSEYIEITAPSTPSSNRVRLYAKDKGGVSALYMKNDAGTEIELGGAGGYSTVEDEGTALTQRTVLNVVGRGAIADDSGGKTRLRIMDYATMFYEFDDFASGDDVNGAVGKLGWSFSGGNITMLAAESGRVGILRRGTGATSGTTAWTRLWDSNNGIFLPSEMFDILFIVRTNHIDSNTIIRIGLSDSDSGSPPTNGIYYERSTSDTTWQAVCRSGGSETKVDTTVVATTSGFHRFRIRRLNSSTIRFELGPDDITTNIPTTGLIPFFHIRNTEASDKTMDVDYFDILITGLAR